jgi:hypothetical protein
MFNPRRFARLAGLLLGITAALYFLRGPQSAMVFMLGGIFSLLIFSLLLYSLLPLALWFLLIRAYFEIYLAKYVFPVVYVKVDGHAVRIPYRRVKGFDIERQAVLPMYEEVTDYVQDRRYRWFVTFMSIPSDDEQLDIPSAAPDVLQAEVLFRWRKIPMMMVKTRGRCPCGRIPACWEGDRYVGMARQVYKGIQWDVIVDITRLDSRPGDRTAARATRNKQGQPLLLPHQLPI